MRKLWQYFMQNKLTNNIQHGLTLHFPGMSGWATAKRLEGLLIGMGFTIGVPSISQRRGFARVEKELCKRRGGARGLATSTPVWSRANPWQGVWERSPPETETKCEIRVQFLRFSCINFLISWIQKRSLDSIFVKTHYSKHPKIKWGLNPPNRPPGYASAFRLSRHGIREQLR